MRMAVAMLIGNSPRLSWSLLSPGGTLAGLLANQFGEAQGLQISALMYAALVLVLLTLLVNMAGEAVLRRAETHLRTVAGRVALFERGEACGVERAAGLEVRVALELGLGLRVGLRRAEKSTAGIR